jgi:hypothetical protein
MDVIKNKNITVLYIAGNGHSGSTLLDIIIGSSPKVFSAGELTFITRDSILEEYCSCGSLIQDCEVWSKIISIWSKNSTISLEDYKKLRLKYERNKVTLRSLKNNWFPSKEFKQYCLTTQKLFSAIQNVTGKNVIVDSTNSPHRIPV